MVEQLRRLAVLRRNGGAMIFYFTGTGNSLHVARELAAVTRVDALHSIAQELRFGPQIYKDETVVIVSPVYYHELPDPVREFVVANTFVCDYFAIVGTYGNRHGGFAELTRRFLEEQGMRADYVNAVMMVDNALPGYDIAEQLRIDPEKQVETQIAAVAADIEARRAYVMPCSEEDLAHHFKLVEKGRIVPTADNPLYRVSGACIGCGVCAQVCPMNCIEVVGGRAVHSYERCAICMACIHACPELAIEFATLREKNAGVHYRNPHISLDDLIAANGEQGSCAASR